MSVIARRLARGDQDRDDSAEKSRLRSAEKSRSSAKGQSSGKGQQGRSAEEQEHEKRRKGTKTHNARQKGQRKSAK